MLTKQYREFFPNFHSISRVVRPREIGELSARIIS